MVWAVIRDYSHWDNSQSAQCSDMEGPVESQKKPTDSITNTTTTTTLSLSLFPLSLCRCWLEQISPSVLFVSGTVRVSHSDQGDVIRRVTRRPLIGIISIYNFPHWVHHQICRKWLLRSLAPFCRHDGRTQIWDCDSDSQHSLHKTPCYVALSPQRRNSNQFLEFEFFSNQSTMAEYIFIYIGCYRW